MMERMTSIELIKEIMDHDVNDAVGKEFDADSENSEIDHEFGFDNPSQDEQDVSNDVDFDDVIFDDVSFDNVNFDIVNFDVEMDDLDFEHEMKELLYDEDVDQGIDVQWQDDPYHNVDEPKEISEMFADLDEALDELDHVVAEEMVADETVDGDDVEQVVSDDVIPHEVYVVMAAQEMMEDHTIAIKRGRVVYDKEDKDNVE
ncbi:hypothetical protein Tco_0655174 [Tanacetum coccineum]|uniref:Uncharacterized protein n=1 Tax=Tanacetum coccineum TaxID=301880 RepID=A0ABQ4X5A6_9ASTR